MTQVASISSAQHSPARTRTHRTPLGVVGTLALAAAIWLTIEFAQWADRHNAAYYAAVEVGQRPSYPAGHYVTGSVLALVLALSVAVALLAATLAFAPRVGWTTAVVVFWTLAAFAIGLAVPASILSPVLGALPLAAGVALGAAASTVRFSGRAGQRTHR